MKNTLLTLCMLVPLTSLVQAQDKEKPEDTEQWKPVPVKVDPGTATKAPSDAMVLFDGTSLNQWMSPKTNGAAPWTVENGAFTVKPETGNIRTKEKFSDCQLHIEWRTPAGIKGEGQDRGNSGIFFMEKYELQVLDNFTNITYSNGQAGSIYKQYIPLVNACRKEGEWQTYDVIFTAPKFNPDGSLDTPARITVLQNNVLVQNNVSLKGPTEYIGQPAYSEHGPLAIELQDHDHKVSYRNIWIRRL